MSRREWLRLGLVVGGVGAAAATGLTFLAPLFQRPSPPVEEIRFRITYRRFPSGTAWWNDLDGTSVRVTDFGEWQGATALWRATYRDGTPVPDTGYPVVVVRVKRDDSVFRAPAEGAVSLPPGFGLYYDDPDRDLRIVVVFDRSTHLCCYPSWHVVTDPPPARDYIAPCPTYEIYGQDPLYDVCHGGQWDPMVLEQGMNPHTGVAYVGARMVRGPGFGPLPVFAVQADSDTLIGAMPDSRWYDYC